MKKILAIALVLTPLTFGLLTACASGDQTAAQKKTACLQHAAAAEVAVTEAYQSTTNLFTSNIISRDKAKLAVVAIDSANALVDSAGRLCAVDEPTASNYLAEAATILLKVKGDTNG